MSLNTASLRSSLSAYLQSLSMRRDLTADQINSGAELSARLTRRSKPSRPRRSSIAKSTVLSDAGKSAALAELSNATVPKFAWLERVVRGHEDDISGTKERLFTVKVPPRFGTEVSVQAAYGAEVRQDYRGLSKNERDAAFAIAAQSGDDATLWSLLNAPVPLVTDAIMQRVLEERAERLNPDTTERLKQVEILHEIFGGLLDAVRIWLRGLGADPKVLYKELGGAEPVISPVESTIMQAMQQV